MSVFASYSEAIHEFRALSPGLLRRFAPRNDKSFEKALINNLIYLYLQRAYPLKLIYSDFLSAELSDVFSVV